MKKKKISIAITALSLLLVVSSNVSADTFKKNRVNGIYSAWYDESVGSYGWTGAIDAARSNWSNISSKVSIGKTTDKTGYSTDEIYVGNSSTPGLLGRAAPYVISWPANIPVNPDDFNWDYSRVSLYHNNLVDLDMNTYDLRKQTATHELGHALGLAHTTGGNKDNSIMKDTSNKYDTTYNPTSYDKSQLKLKWGN